jgi:hypothetical protein
MTKAEVIAIMGPGGFDLDEEYYLDIDDRPPLTVKHSISWSALEPGRAKHYLVILDDNLVVREKMVNGYVLTLTVP